MIVLEEQPIVFEGLKNIIENKINNVKICWVKSMEEAIANLDYEEYELGILGFDLKSKKTFEFIEQSKKNGSIKKHIVFTSSKSVWDIKKASKLGVEGYVFKESMPEDIIYAINSVLKGRKYVDSAFMDEEFKIKEEMVSSLTPRELEILFLLGKCFNNKEIALNLNISINTVKKHITNIFSKLEFNDRREVLLFLQNL